MGNLTSTYRNQGQWNEAEEVEVQVMEISKRVLESEHHDTLSGMNNLAFTLMSQGCNGEAIPHMGKCFQLQKYVLSPQHAWTTLLLETLKKWQVENNEISALNVSIAYYSARALSEPVRHASYPNIITSKSSQHERVITPPP
jgi:hypothetical protein